MAFIMAIPMAGVATLVALSQNWFRLKVPSDEESRGTESKDEKKDASV